MLSAGELSHHRVVKVLSFGCRSLMFLGVLKGVLCSVSKGENIVWFLVLSMTWGI